ncbi:MAG: hypothetical protein E2576_14430 [Alcaligenaceae bacterium]|nr:hypothetical protein [Alcaligenaceae bacterium SAGV5]MPS50423.1 hypothetical protein [Alcaligenaceae bacterium SAGV3]MPT57916.1 hypothetical protein [Alcaligenaceae bacterium]
MDPLSLIPLATGILDLGKALVSARDEAKRIELVAQLNEKTLGMQMLAVQAFALADSLREDKAALLQEKQTLEDEVRALKDRRAELEEYVLHRLPTGAMVRRRYSLDEEPIEPPVYICANCAARGEVTFLQPQSSGVFLHCPAGHARIATGKRSPPPNRRIVARMV